MIELDRIYNEDCLVGMKEIPDNSVDLILTDPPYLIGGGGDGGSINNVKKLKKSLKQIDDIKNGYDIRKMADEVKRLQGKNINAYFWCSKLQIPDYLQVYVVEMKCKFDIISWHKRNALPTYANKYLCDTEYCLFFHKGKGQTHPQNYEDAKTYNIGLINHEDKKLWKHPTIKPIDMVMCFVRNSSQEGDIILDPFMGSGTTAIAALREHRHFIGFELNKEYYDKACERIGNEQLTLFN